MHKEMSMTVPTAAVHRISRIVLRSVPITRVLLALAVVVTVAVTVAACGSDSPIEPVAGLSGTWKGVVAANGRAPAESLMVIILPDGRGGYDGAAEVTPSLTGDNFPTASLTLFVSVTAGDSLYFSADGPTYWFNGHYSGSTMTGVMGGALVGPITLTKQ